MSATHGQHFWRITAPHYVAGLILCTDIVIAAAPILNWTIGKTSAYLYRYFTSKGFTVEEIP